MVLMYFINQKRYTRIFDLFIVTNFFSFQNERPINIDDSYSTFSYLNFLK